jgi:hypothetical protein
MRRDNRTCKARAAALDASIMRGLADAEAGRLTPAAAVFDRLERKYGTLQAATTTTAPRPNSRLHHARRRSPPVKAGIRVDRAWSAPV